MSDECRFETGKGNYCLTHRDEDEVSYSPVLCSHAAAALQARVVASENQVRVRDLQARVRELEAETQTAIEISVEQAGRLSRAEATVARLREALAEITTGKGAYSRNPLEYCSNAVESMKEIARAALAASEATK